MWREYNTGDRQSPGLLNSDLRQIATAIMEGTGYALSSALLMQLIRRRFNVGVEGVDDSLNLGKVSPMALALRDPSPLETAVANDIARRAIERLSPLQKQILRVMTDRLPVPTVRDIAHELGVSKSLVSKQQRATAEVFRTLHVAHNDEQEQVLAAVSRILQL
jgi:hypothetical protein